MGVAPTVDACVWDLCSSQSCCSVCPGATVSPQGTSLLYGTSSPCGALSPRGSLSPCGASSPQETQSPYGALSPRGALSPCGTLSLRKMSAAPCGASLNTAALSPFEADIVAHRALPLSPVPAPALAAGSLLLPHALPTQGHDGSLWLCLLGDGNPFCLFCLPAWGCGHLLAPQGPDHPPLSGDRILECLHGNKLIRA